ncbi:glycosyltransferase family 4 protein [Thioalkalicoccus limnaeus]|uniref:Glycosyltransferase family 4 protein n=1 Tax=Thioalkalicoccus limnaeus TaxID=120681 RepID=A0ABV4BDX3_9GAMM
MLDDASVVVGAAATAFALAAAGSYAMSRGRIPWLQMLDQPNTRSLHLHPVPRGGGLAILVAVAIALLFAAPVLGARAELLWIAASVLPVAIVSLFDDRGHVRPPVRLMIHVFSAVVLLVGGIGWWQILWPGGHWLPPAPLAMLLTVLFVVWMTNLYNFMDGLDGLAGGMATVGFGVLAALGWQGGDPLFAAVAATIAAAAAGFLTQNLPRARLFMGDVGSSSLGFLAAALALWGSGSGLFPLWVAWLAFAPFIVDATWTLLRRLVAGEPVWQAHRSHHYQRLVGAGWSHRQTLIWAYLLFAATGASAWMAPAMVPSEQWFLLAAWAAILVLIHLKIGLLERKHDRG